MDYAAWTHRASQFLRSLTHLPGKLEVHDGIEAPADNRDKQAWLNSETCSLPTELREFVGKASRRCYISYRWAAPESSLSALASSYPGRTELSGEADLCEAARFSNYDNRDRIANLMGGRLFGGIAHVDDPERLRGRIAILLMPRNGDKISLICQGESVGAIVYVRAGEADGFVIARSFDDFLLAWEKIAYVTPSFENLKPWLDARTGLLSPDEAGAHRLRQLLGEASARGREQCSSDAPKETLAWMQRAIAFVRQLNHLPGEWGISACVEPPISNEQADRLATQLPLGLPAPLRNLYVDGAAKFKCRYHWKPPGNCLPAIERVLPHQYSLYGGPSFIPFSELLESHRVHTWWDHVHDSDTEEQQRARAAWLRTVPFIAVGNGDYVGLHVTEDPKKLPVVYLCHDDSEHPVTEISQSLEQFLTEWEKLLYLGPQIWLLDPFLDGSETGQLNGGSGKARKWREFLTRTDDSMDSQ